MAGPGLIVGGQALQQDENSQFTNQHLAQLILERALAIQNQRRQIDFQTQGRAGAAAGLFGPNPIAGGASDPLSVAQAFAPPSGPPLDTPAPGQASVPMGPPPMADNSGAPPTLMPPGASPVAQGEAAPENAPSPEASTPQAAPPGWQTSNAAPPELGGTTTPDENVAQASVGAPPPPPQLPKGMTTTNMIAALQKNTTMSPQDKLAALEYLHPIIKANEAEMLANFRIENEGLKRANDAYKAYVGNKLADARVLNYQSQDTAREARAANAADVTQLRRDQLAQNLTLAQQKLANQGTAPGAAAAGEELTAGGKAVAAELSRAGIPLPSGGRGGAAGVARSNMILNQMALDEEGGAGSGGVAGQRGAYKADTGSLAFQQKQVDSIERSSRKIEKDIGTLEKYIDSGTAGSVTLVNKPINYLRENFSDPALTEFAVAAKLVGVEYERMINGGLMSVAQLHEGAREDAAKLINESMTPEQIRRVLPVMRQEIQNAKDSSHEQLADIQVRMRQGLKGTVQPDGTRINLTPSATPTDKAAVQQDLALKSKVEASGEKYDPDRFDYRIGPAGQVQKKAK